jgi:ribosomal protein L35AE/L33A
MRRMLAGAVFALVLSGAASAQGLSYQQQGKPIDPNKLVVQPADTATNIFSSASRYVSRVVANTVENNGFVKTINNLLGRTPSTPNTVQPGYSRLPDPRTYQSSAYPNSFTPVMPTTQVYGQSPVVGR